MVAVVVVFHGLSLKHTQKDPPCLPLQEIVPQVAAQLEAAVASRGQSNLWNTSFSNMSCCQTHMQNSGKQLRATGCSCMELRYSEQTTKVKQVCEKTQPRCIFHVSGSCRTRMCPWSMVQIRYCEIWIERTDVSRGRVLPDGILASSGEANTHTQSQPSTERTLSNALCSTQAVNTPTE